MICQNWIEILSVGVQKEIKYNVRFAVEGRRYMYVLMYTLRYVFCTNTQIPTKDGRKQKFFPQQHDTRLRKRGFVAAKLQLDDTLRSLRVRPLQSNTSYSFSLTFFCSLFPVYQFFHYSNKITDSNRPAIFNV